jgi:hypothetical protein
VAICLTDLPMVAGGRPVVGDPSVADRVGLVSVPALGAIPTRKRAREAIVRLLDELVEWDLRPRGRFGRRVTPRDDAVDVRILGRGFAAACASWRAWCWPGSRRRRRPSAARWARASRATRPSARPPTASAGGVGRCRWKMRAHEDRARWRRPTAAPRHLRT